MMVVIACRSSLLDFYVSAGDSGFFARSNLDSASSLSVSDLGTPTLVDEIAGSA
jgi:hypothetical protein